MKQEAHNIAAAMDCRHIELPLDIRSGMSMIIMVVHRQGENTFMAVIVQFHCVQMRIGSAGQQQRNQGQAAQKPAELSGNGDRNRLHAQNIPFAR